MSDPAFRNPHLGISHFGDPGSYPGLTKRELFAAMALHGILWADESPEMTAAQAVARADALLAELDKPTPPST